MSWCSIVSELCMELYMMTYWYCEGVKVYVQAVWLGISCTSFIRMLIGSGACCAGVYTLFKSKLCGTFYYMFLRPNIF